jgi:hypothetical protein
MRIFLIICFVLFLDCSLVYSTETINLHYNLQKGDILDYQIKIISSGKSKYLKDLEWRNFEPQTTSWDLTMTVADISKGKDGTQIYHIEFQVLQGKNKVIFPAKVSEKGIFFFSNEEEKKRFLQEFTKALVAGLLFPEIPSTPIELDSKFKSLDVVMAFHRDYNKAFPRKDILVDELKLSKHKNKSNLVIMEGSNGGEFEESGVEYDQKFEKYYEFDYELGVVTLGRFHREKKTIPKDPVLSKEMRERFDDNTWQIELLKINGKDVK